MSRVLNQREKFLSFLVGGAVLLIINFFLFDYILAQHARLGRETTLKTTQLASMKKLLAEAPRWTQEDARIRSTQPRLENEATAGVQLLDQIQALAGEDGVTVETPAFGPIDRQPAYVSVSVTLDTKSTWKALVQFLTKLQGRQRFLVVESGELQVDTTDQTQMRGKFRIAKWYAPK